MKTRIFISGLLIAVFIVGIASAASGDVIFSESVNTSQNFTKTWAGSAVRVYHGVQGITTIYNIDQGSAQAPSGNAIYAGGASSPSVFQIAQNFTPAKSQFVGFNISREGSYGTLLGNLVVELSEDPVWVGNPIIASAVITNTTWLAQPVHTPITVYMPAVLNPSKKYVVKTYDTITETEAIYFADLGGATYSGGAISFSSNGGTTWTAWGSAPTEDLFFATLFAKNTEATNITVNGVNTTSLDTLDATGMLSNSSINTWNGTYNYQNGFNKSSDFSDIFVANAGGYTTNPVVVNGWGWTNSNESIQSASDTTARYVTLKVNTILPVKGLNITATAFNNNVNTGLVEISSDNSSYTTIWDLPASASAQTSTISTNQVDGNKSFYLKLSKDTTNGYIRWDDLRIEANLNTTISNQSVQTYQTGTNTVNITSFGNAVSSSLDPSLQANVSLIEGEAAIEPALIPDFIANATTGYPNDYFQFTDLTTDSPTTWNWTFGDSGVSTSQNPVHQYTAVGSYSVSLNVTNTTTYNETTKLNYITISELPLPSNLVISANKTYSTENPFVVSFTTSAINFRFKYRNISFGDTTWYNTSTSSDTSVVHTYSTIGDFNVTLYETNANGTAYNKSIDFIVVSNPTLVMYPQNLSVSRGVTNMMTLRVSNLSHVDGGATNLTFNKTAVTIDSITANSTSSQNFTVTSTIDNTNGVARIGISCIDISSLASNVDIVDIVWRSNTTTTNLTAPVAFNTTAFTSFVKSNSSYNEFRYPNITYLVPGVITLTNQTWTKTLLFKNAYNLNPVSGIQVRISYTGVINGSDTTNTGMYLLSSTYGSTLVTAAADGYYNVTQSVTFDNNGTDTFLMTPLSGAPGQTTWYIPQQVRIYAVNSMGIPINGVYVKCTPLDFTAPDDWTQILIGIQPSVNMSGTTLDGWTGSDGSWVAPMLSSFQYEFNLVNASEGINHTVRFNPLDTSYRIYVNTVSQPNNTLLQVTQSSLPFYKLNSTGYYNLSMIYQDSLGYTTFLQFNVKDYTHGNTLVYTKNWTNPGTSVIIENYTAYVPQGQEYVWQYNATKV